MYIAIILLSIGQPSQVAQVVGDTLPLSLADATELAREFNPSLRAERADALAAAQAPLAASRAFLPTVALGVQAIRTTDPVAVFGLKLRQENFAAEDLGLDPLNRPTPYSGYNSSVTVELPVFAPEGLFGYSAAKRSAAAGMAAADRAAGATVFRVVNAYWDAQLASRRVEALASARDAARAHAEQGDALERQGMVTGLDARRARLRAAAIEADLVVAEAEAENALSMLRSLLALPDSQPVALTDSLVGNGGAECRDDTGGCDVNARQDLAALRFAGEASAAALKSAWASNLPALAAFGSFGRYGRSSPFGGGSGDWTIGIGVSWKPFQGLAGAAAVRRARAEREAVEQRAEAAERQARLEIVTARRRVDAAERRLAVAESASLEARAALEQARVRYRTGIAPISELLDVEAAVTAATLNVFTARHGLFVAQAALEFAFGVHDQ